MVYLLNIGKYYVSVYCNLMYLFYHDHQIPWGDTVGKGENVAAALKRLDEEIANSEKSRPIARLAVVSAEMDSLQQVKSYNMPVGFLL